MSTPSHLNIYSIPRLSTNDSFTLFPLLPTELRLKIWRFSLQRQRLISALLEVNLVYGYTGTSWHGMGYRVCVEGCQVHSKLLRVSAEARRAAIDFYRVRVPCIFTKDLDSVIELGYERRSAEKRGAVYINPEYDVLRISSQLSGWATVAVEFLHDIKTVYDPRRVGLRNLAVNSVELSLLTESLEQENNIPTTREKFLATFRQLDEVFFVADSGRIMASWVTLHPAMFNRSCPVMSKTPTFDRLERDPRDIYPDLRRVFTDCDARGMFKTWMDLPGWGASPPSNIKYRILIVNRTPVHHIYDRKTAIAWLEKEDEFWQHPSSGSCDVMRDRDIQYAGIDWSSGDTATYKRIAVSGWPYPIGESPQEVQPVIGFWLFPIEALDEFPCNRDRSTESFLKNLSKYWPELAVADIA